MKRLYPCAAVLFALLVVVTAFSEQRDFQYFACALKLYSQGAALYGSPEYGACAVTRGQIGPPSSYVFPYPPQIFVALSPFLLFPDSWWRSLLGLCGAALSTFAFILFAHSAGADRSQRSSMLALAVAATAPPLLLSAAIGQLTPVFLLVLACFLCAVQSRWGRAAFVQGLCLGLFVMKPQLVWLLVPVWLLVLGMRERMELVSGALVSGGALSAVAWWMNPDSFIAYFEVGLRNVVIFDTPTVASFLGSYLPGGKFVAAGVVGAGFITCVLLFKQHIPLSLHVAALLVAGSLLASPYLWTYDYALLLPLMLSACAARQDRAATSRAAILLAVNSLMFVQYSVAKAAGSSKPDSNDLWYPIAVLLLCTASALRQRSEIKPLQGDA